jgi:hypothetical protein
LRNYYPWRSDSWGDHKHRHIGHVHTKKWHTRRPGENLYGYKTGHSHTTTPPTTAPGQTETVIVSKAPVVEKTVVLDEDTEEDGDVEEDTDTLDE